MLVLYAERERVGGEEIGVCNQFNHCVFWDVPKFMKPNQCGCEYLPAMEL